MTPPPPSPPLPSGRCQALRSKRPGATSAKRAALAPASSSSSASKAAQMSSRSRSNHALASILRAATTSLPAPVILDRHSPDDSEHLPQETPIERLRTHYTILPPQQHRLGHHAPTRR